MTSETHNTALGYSAVLAWLNINILQTESSLANIIRILAFSKKGYNKLAFCLENQNPNR